MFIILKLSGENMDMAFMQLFILLLHTKILEEKCAHWFSVSLTPVSRVRDLVKTNMPLVRTEDWRVLKSQPWSHN